MSLNSEFSKIINDLKENKRNILKCGGEVSVQKQHKKGRLTARERIDYLFDNKSKSIEIGAFAGDLMYVEHGGCPSGGVVVKIGYISQKQCIVVANDATVVNCSVLPSESNVNILSPFAGVTSLNSEISTVKVTPPDAPPPLNPKPSGPYIF